MPRGPEFPPVAGAGERMPPRSARRWSWAQPRCDGAVVEPRRIELLLPHYEHRDAQGVAIEQRSIARDIDALDRDREIQAHPLERAERLRAEAAVRLLQQANRDQRATVRPAADERERAAQLATHHRGFGLTSSRADPGRSREAARRRGG